MLLFIATGIYPILLKQANVQNKIIIDLCYQFFEQNRVFQTIRTYNINSKSGNSSMCVLNIMHKMKLCLCRSAHVISLCFDRQFHSRAVCQVYYIISLY